MEVLEIRVGRCKINIDKWGSWSRMMMILMEMKEKKMRVTKRTWGLWMMMMKKRRAIIIFESKSFKTQIG
jgi:hypothetical protein